MFLMFYSIVAVSPAYAETSGSKSYQLLAPLPNFGNSYTPGQFGKYVENIIKLSITVAAILAVLMIVLGGFKYMMSESVGKKSEGKDQIQGAILGLIILAASFLILNTINPEILKFNLTIQGVNVPPASDQPSASTISEQTPLQQQTRESTGVQTGETYSVPNPNSSTGKAELSRLTELCKTTTGNSSAFMSPNVQIGGGETTWTCQTPAKTK
jgi:hypothetical protein